MAHLPRCCNTDKNAKGRVTFGKLPEDENRKKNGGLLRQNEWVNLKPGNCFVCSNHFTANNYEQHLQVGELLILLVLRILIINNTWYSAFKVDFIPVILRGYAKLILESKWQFYLLLRQYNIKTLIFVHENKP